MSGSAPILPLIQFSNAAGAPLANGTVTTYLAGSLTLTPTWQDEDLSILNANPIELDSSGQALVYLDPTKRYKFLLKNAGGATVAGWPLDNIAPALTSATGETTVTAFGAVGDGITDDSAALQAAITHAKTYGLRLTAPAGTFKCRAIDISGGTLPWSFYGAGKDQTIFKHSDGNGTLFNGTGGSVPFELGDFTLDCQFSETAHASANHALAFYNTSGVRLYRLRARNYKNSGILGYATTANTFGDCIGVECETVGNGLTTNNGMLFASMPRCQWINCVATDCLGNPGYGIQIKNDSRFCSIVNGYAEDCTAGLALGSDTVGEGAASATISGFQALGCGAGAVFGEAKQCRVDGLVIDMESAVENGIDFGDGCVGNTVYATVRNINAGRTATRVRSGAIDNTVTLGCVDNINTTGSAAAFDSGSQRNIVRVERVTSPTSSASGPRNWWNDNSIAQNNGFEIVGHPFHDSVTIASGVVTMKNTLGKSLQIDTEAAAASDDLATITGPAIEGQTVAIRTANDGRDVVVKHGTGNIWLSGAVDFTLTTRRSVLVLWYSTLNDKWNELSRVTNP